MADIRALATATQLTALTELDFVNGQPMTVSPRDASEEAAAPHVHAVTAAAAAARPRDHGPGEQLDTFLVAFQNPGMYVDRVADLELRHIFAQRRLFNRCQYLLTHDFESSFFPSKSARTRRVFKKPCSFRHRAIAAWSPLIRISGT